MLRAPRASSTAEHDYTRTHTRKALGVGGSKRNEKTKWPGKALKQLFFLAPHFAQGSKRGPSKEKSQAAGSASCAAPEIGAELSELGPAKEDSCSSLGPIPLGVVQTMGTRCLFSRTRGKQPKTKFRADGSGPNPGI